MGDRIETGMSFGTVTARVSSNIPSVTEVDPDFYDYVAERLGVSRTEAKEEVYRRIYGSEKSPFNAR